MANLMAKNNVVALLDPHQKRLPVMIGEINKAERNGILAAHRGISGHYGSRRVFPADGERADRGAGRDRIPRSAV